MIIHMNILLVIGIVILLGALGGRIFQKLRLPSVMGYIMIGVLLGESFNGVLSGPNIESFTPLLNLALGIIGFMIGSELNFDRFKRYSTSIYTILFCETIFTFCGITLVVTLITKHLYMGLILGALASATAPAATYNVLGEYKARGPLTMTTLSIVALDDVLALLIYALASTFAIALVNHETVSWVNTIALPAYDICLSVIIGAVSAVVLHKVVTISKDPERLLPFTLGTIIMVVGSSIYLEVDFILACMTLGAIVSNMQSSDNREIFDTLKKFSYPIYILFFVLVGARLDMHILIQRGVPILAFFYIVTRSICKMSGAFLGGKLSKAKDTVSKYLGFCLFDQAGVAVGLSIAIYNKFSSIGYEDTGILIINLVTATTFLLQFIAPPMIKYGVKKADEMYRNITAEDIIGTYKIKDVMEQDFIPIKESDNLHQILEVMKRSDGYYFSVTGLNGQFIGVTSLGEIRETFYEEQMDMLVVAGDIVSETSDLVYAESDLKTAVDIFRGRNIDYLPVLDNETSRKLVGQLDNKKLMDRVSKEVIIRQQELES